MNVFDKNREEIVTGFGLLFMGLSYEIYRVAKKAADYILSAKSINAGDGLTGSILTDNEGGLLVPMYVAVRGRVVAMNPGQSVANSSDMAAVIQTKNMVEHSVYKVASFWADSSRKRQSGLNFIPFGLISPNDYNTMGESPKSASYNSSDIVVVENVETFGEMDQALVNVKQEMVIPQDFSLIRLIIGYLTDRYSIATYQEEQILPVGSIVTIFGELSKMKNGQMRISNPSSADTPFILTMKTAKRVKEGYQSTTNICWFLFQGSVLLFTVSVAFLCAKWWSKYKMRRTHRLVTAQRNTDESRLTGLHDSQICIICLGNPREVLLIPCGHVCICADCCLLVNRKCPVCRVEFNDIHPAFIS